MQESIILDILQEMGALDNDVRSQIESYAEAGGISHEEALDALNIMTLEDCHLLIADAVGVETVRVEHLVPSPEALALLPVEYARKNRLLPLNICDGILTVATDEPSETGRLDSLGNALGLSIAPVTCSKRQLEQAIDHWYSATAHAVQDELGAVAVQVQAEVEKRELAQSRSSFTTGRPSLTGESQVALVPLVWVHSNLTQMAERHRHLVEVLAAATDDGTKDLMDDARAALAKGDYDGTDAALATAEQFHLDLALREAASVSEHNHRAARMRSERGRIAMIRRDHLGATRLFRGAIDLARGADRQQLGA